MHYKDEILNDLAQKGNVAQFISYDASMNQRFLNINGVEPNTHHEMQEAIALLITRSSENSVNVRSFDPAQPKGCPFKYGCTSVQEVVEQIRFNASEGRFSIINEKIDINDGGVSGVMMGNIIEVTPGDTPKGVDKPGVCRFTKRMGLHVLKTIYGFVPDLDYPETTRVEFSIHPIRRGIKMSNTIIWELEEFDTVFDNKQMVQWPNNFSKLIGDKAFGLIIADYLNITVPRTTVISRKVAPFTFGTPTGIVENWLRTAPAVRTPGKFTTTKGWVDLFQVMQNEDPNFDLIASVLSQDGVDHLYSGSLITGADNRPIIEGVAGRGDGFMVGNAKPVDLPENLIGGLNELFDYMYSVLGAVEMEWVFDGTVLWIVQLHNSEATSSHGLIIVDGDAENWIDFEVSRGLPALTELIESVSLEATHTVGINLVGNVGLTSHYGDILRKAKVPSKIIKAAAVTS